MTTLRSLTVTKTFTSWFLWNVEGSAGRGCVSLIFMPVGGKFLTLQG